MKIFYDFHIHSCLSPCGDDDNTPYNIVNMAALNGLNAIAVTDHNSVQNCRATIAAAKNSDILVVPGMELTTSEDIHLLCLFAELKGAEEFEKLVKSKMLKVANNKKIFGNQLLYNENDKICGEEQYLLTPSSNIPIYKAAEILKSFGGIAMPAHIDREANGIISILGEIDIDLGFTSLEFSLGDSLKKQSLKKQYHMYNQITNSDAHCLFCISEAKYSMDLTEISSKEIIKFLSLKNG